jgi:hypothetical protein
MTATLAVIREQVAPLPALPAADIDRAAAFARQDKAPATRAAYRADFAAFQAFCHSRQWTCCRPTSATRTCSVIMLAGVALMADTNITELRPGPVNDPTNALRQRRHRKRKAQSSVTAHASRAQTACRETSTISNRT